MPSQSEDEDDCSAHSRQNVSHCRQQSYSGLCSLGRSCLTYLLITPFSLIFSFFRQGHAAAVVEKKVYIFGGSSGSGFGGQHSDSTSDPIYLNDLFLLKGMQGLYRNLKC